jgi:murein DD-endopeptidase MepM/ murein hydrolase activator NlpD
MEANPIIPDSVTTLPPGLPMEIPIYFKPFWGSAYQIIPDSLFVNGPEQIGFETQEFTNAYPGWLNGYLAYAAGANRTGAQIVDYVAQNFSVSPQLLLALLEHQAGALSQSAPTAETINYPLGNVDRSHRGLYLQLVWAANTLNDYFYQWRQGTLQEFDLQDGRVQRPDPWQNAATVSLHAYFNQLYSPDVYEQAISPAGLAATYLALFGDPWLAAQPHIPGSLEQPPFSLPFEPGKIWALSGGPHTAWGEGEPLAALDFAPPAVAGGCLSSPEWATAVAPGVVVRSEPGTVTLDLDGDGDERTGWVVFYFHMATEDRVPVGTSLQTGDFIGHPSCEGGRATGTHIHIARKYNGEWIPADGPLAFNLAGWLAHAGDQRYQGTLTLNERTIIACVGCANQASLISAEKP